MSTITIRLHTLSAGGTFIMRLLAETCRRISAGFGVWRNNMRQRREMLMLNAVELRELSLIEADINREAGKPFWQRVHLTGR